MPAAAPSPLGRIAILVLLLILGGLMWWRSILILPKDPNAPIQRVPHLGPGDSPAELAKKPLRILFVGNSYTFTNDIPAMVRHLAAMGDHPWRLECTEECISGASLRGHCLSRHPVQLLHESQYDWMVLQEFSLIPAMPPEQLEQEMYPFVTHLYEAATRHNTRTLLYMTWGRQNGDTSLKDDTYEAMQTRVTSAYETIAERLQVQVAPIGLAWRTAIREQPTIKLWSGDGSHPSEAGSYLAACIFYRIFCNKSPVGNLYTANLTASEAQLLQEIAERTVAGYKVQNPK